jgi:hypothetical protein
MTSSDLVTIFTTFGDTTLCLAANGLMLMAKGLLTLGDRCAKGAAHLYDIVDGEEEPEVVPIEAHDDD